MGDHLPVHIAYLVQKKLKIVNTNHPNDLSYTTNPAALEKFIRHSTYCYLPAQLSMKLACLVEWVDTRALKALAFYLSVLVQVQQQARS